MAKRPAQNDPISSSTDFAEDMISRVLDVFQRFNNKLTTQNTTRSIDTAIGTECEVSVSIPVGGTGEVIVKHGGSLRNYSARCSKKNASFKRGSKVIVADAVGDLVYVDEY